MNIQILSPFVVRTLERSTNDYLSAIESIDRYIPGMAVNEYGIPLPFVAQLFLIGGKMSNSDFFAIEEHCKIRTFVTVFDTEEEKVEFEKKHGLI